MDPRKSAKLESSCVESNYLHGYNLKRIFGLICTKVRYVTKQKKSFSDAMYIKKLSFQHIVSHKFVYDLFTFFLPLGSNVVVGNVVVSNVVVVVVTGNIRII